MIEIWKTIEEYPKYEVSNKGNVRHNGRFLKGHLDISGYRYVLLYNDNGRKQKKVHRLVALAFIPNPQSKPIINHKNGIKTDNQVENLEWVTNQENMLHAHRIGLITKEMMCEARIHLRKPIVKTFNGIVVARYESLSQASEFEDRKKATISQYCRGCYKDTRGYEWRYEK